jgi:hypothetical protein
MKDTTSRDEQVMLERLRTSLRTTLVNYQVPFVEKSQCAKGFVFSVFYLEWSKKQLAYVFSSSTQVGDAPNVTPLSSYVSNKDAVLAKDVTLGPDAILGNNLFDAYVSDFLSYAEVTGAETLNAVLLKSNEDAFRDLALSWWDDNPTGLQPLSWLPQAIGLSFVVLICVTAFILYVYRRRRNLKRSRSGAL